MIREAWLAPVDGQLRVQPFLAGEVACENLRPRAEVLSLLQALPASPVATDTEVLFFMDQQAGLGRGIGYVGVPPLNSAWFI